ncbi:PST family polysaccharide transporter [Dysgonomonas alginatilytica]|uniref:PST family polysaccharide transporter n=1 Tax=Dysgonomonas alginatilytica TaxID=1605892 RepID=A0A2V3PTV6_9BACT|nr:oligosaccharide flippase family protein [Dysgonomonas alginatilytica]PXV67432.1 PST family polysaccharide transporter [Dysgonomonas alginatilytica]
MATDKTDNKSYKQILKSTSVFGGSQIITILIGIIRNKILAILLGAAGVGLISIYQSTLDMIKSMSSLGIETTGVREIAAIHEDDKSRLYHIISIIDRWALIFATLGAGICLVLCYPISLWVFGDSSHSFEFALLSISMFFTILAAGQAVVLQGLRRISYMVKSAILWNTLGLLISVPLYYFYRLDGIVPVFIIVSIAMFLSAYFYRRKIDLESVPVSFDQLKKKGASVLRVGIFIVLASILTSFSFFLVRAFLSKNAGLESIGLFQAAWTITNVYLMLILKSMGSDFYPRLCAIIADNTKTKLLINEQTYIVLIVAVPMIVLLLLSSKVVLSLLYSFDFENAAAILNWQILGTFFKVLSWPLGFILLAKGKGLIYFFSETLFLLIYIGSMYCLFPFYNFDSVGMAYLIAYSLYLPLVFVLGRKLSRFEWTNENLTIGFISFILVLLAFCIVKYAPNYIIIAGIPLWVLSLLFSLYKLNKVFRLKSLSGLFSK